MSKSSPLYCVKCGYTLTNIPHPEPSSWGDYWKCEQCGSRYQRSYPDRMSGAHHDYTITLYDEGTIFEWESDG